MEKKITEIRKRDIRNALVDFCDRFGGQSKASKIMEGVSSATISQVINENWELISDDMWRKIASQIGLQDEKWETVETTNYKDLHEILGDAQENQLWMAITGNAGTGKTYACKQYQRMHNACNRRASPVLYIGCSSCNGTGCGNSAKENRSYICRSLRYKFSIGVVLGIYHIICNNAG